MVRVLHTSDWHLGASLDGVSREEEHQAFLDWLLEQLKVREVDLLLVAGDVFDHAQPSAEAQRMYYRFLSRLGATGVRGAVVVGGNHDSPSRLEAPREVLAGLGVHVVGGLQADEETWDRCLFPLRDNDGQVEMAVAAVPYVHEHRLGVRTSMVEPDAVRAAFRERFSHLYRTLTDGALELGGGAPVVATGHLSCVGGEVEDAPVEIHLASSTDGLPAEVFDERLAYVALGHFHRMFRVRESKARYSGSPVPLNARESKTPCQVLMVDVSADGETSVEPLEVPRQRDVLHMAGPLEELLDKLNALTWDTPRPPLVYATLEVEGYEPGLEIKLQREAASAAEADDAGAPLLVKVTQELVGGFEGGDEEEGPAVDLESLTMEQVFRRLCQARRVEPDEALLTAFRQVLTPDDEEEDA